MPIIYILTNEAMPNYVKIGRTENLEQRMRSLYTDRKALIPKLEKIYNAAR